MSQGETENKRCQGGEGDLRVVTGIILFFAGTADTYSVDMEHGRGRGKSRLLHGSWRREGSLKVWRMAGTWM
jgi:hypothetical protein